MRFDNYTFELTIKGERCSSMTVIGLDIGKADLEAHPWLIDALNRAKFLIERVINESNIQTEE